MTDTATVPTFRTLSDEDIKYLTRYFREDKRPLDSLVRDFREYCTDTLACVPASPADRVQGCDPDAIEKLIHKAKRPQKHARTIQGRANEIVRKRRYGVRKYIKANVKWAKGPSDAWPRCVLPKKRIALFWVGTDKEGADGVIRTSVRLPDHVLKHHAEGYIHYPTPEQIEALVDYCLEHNVR